MDGMVPTKVLARRRERAQNDRDRFQPLLDEGFAYAVPYRQPAVDSRGSDNKGEERVDKAYDMTAIISAFRFAGKLQSDLDPSQHEIVPGDLLPKQIKDQLKPELEAASIITRAMMSTGEYDMSFHEMGLDLAVSTGAQLILEGDDEKPARFVTVPIDEILLEGGPYGDVSGVFWTRKWSLQSIADEFGEDGFCQKLKEKLEEEPEAEIVLHQDCLFDPKKKRWVNHVWSKDNDDKLFATWTARTKPWITPRYFRVPGEVMGRGPVMLALPTIKTLNTAQRLTLQAAAIAMLGIYTAIDDGVFNPDLSPLDPGAVWKVARNGGVLGPSVQRFPDPRLDLSGIVVKELQMTVQAALMDQSLPPDGAAVRSATEILERAKRLASDYLGAFGRLVHEIVVPTVKRLIEIAYNKRLIKFKPQIDEILTRLQINSNVAKAKTAERLQQTIQWIEMVLAILQERAGRVAHLETALADIGSDMGVKSEYIVTAQEREAMDKAEQDQQMAIAAAGAAAGGQGQPV